MQMTKVIGVSDEAYEFILSRASKQSVEQQRSVSMTEVIDEIVDAARKSSK